MEIALDKRTVRQIRLAVTDALEEGDHETLRDDLVNIFNEEQIEEIERLKTLMTLSTVKDSKVLPYQYS